MMMAASLLSRFARVERLSRLRDGFLPTVETREGNCGSANGIPGRRAEDYRTILFRIE